MEDLNKSKRQLTFYGEGSKLFGITIVNAIFTVLTLGLYYPWAKVAKLHYLYHETEFEGSRFEFHGKGKEVFKGFIKAMAILALVYALIISGQLMMENWIIGLVLMLTAYAILAFLIPLAIHGAARYRLSRTSWRGIHFGYRGDRKELVNIFVKGVLLSIVTFGIYSFWLAIQIRKYVIGHVRFGSISFSYEGKGSENFWLNFKGYFFSAFTLGIYFPWYIKNIINYYINNIKIHQDGKVIKVRSSITGGAYFGLLIVNFFIVIFTLGFGTPWAVIRTMRFVLSNVTIEGALDTEAIHQTEEDYKNATGDDMADMLDLDLI